MTIKAWGPLFALIGLLGLSGSGLWVEYSQPHNQHQPSKSENRNSPAGKAIAGSTSEPNETKGTEKKAWFEPFFEKPTDSLLVLFNAVLALFTARLYFATRGLVDAANNQSKDIKASTKAATDAANAAIASNQIAVVTSERELRAYVTARDLTIVTNRQMGRIGTMNNNVIEGAIHTYGLAAILRNGGQTPALDVVINASLQKLSNKVIAVTDFPDSSLFGYGVIGPDGEMHTPLIRTAAAVFEPIEPEHEWYLWGWVEYDDIFTASGSTSRNRTEFCFQVERVRLPFTNELWVGFKPYERFNAVDWGCTRKIDPMTNKSEPN